MTGLKNNQKPIATNAFQEELAKTYFSSHTAKEERDSPSQQTFNIKKKNRTPFIILLAMICFFIAALFVFKRLEVAVKVAPLDSTRLAENSSAEDLIPMSKDGELNRDIIKNIMFYENANAQSKWGKEFILLSNELSSKKAILGIDFNRPINMGVYTFYFYTKGKLGGEHLKLALRDKKNQFCRTKINVLPNSWQRFSIDAENAREFIDPESVTHIDFEVNPEESGNLSRSTIYIKDVCFIKKEGG